MGKSFLWRMVDEKLSILKIAVIQSRHYWRCGMSRLNSEISTYEISYMNQYFSFHFCKRLTVVFNWYQGGQRRWRQVDFLLFFSKKIISILMAFPTMTVEPWNIGGEMPFFPIKHEQPMMNKQVRIYFLFLQIDILL